MLDFGLLCLEDDWDKWVQPRGREPAFQVAAPEVLIPGSCCPRRENLFLREPGRRDLHLKREMLCLTKGFNRSCKYTCGMSRTCDFSDVRERGVIIMPDGF